MQVLKLTESRLTEDYDQKMIDLLEERGVEDRPAVGLEGRRPETAEDISLPELTREEFSEDPELFQSQLLPQIGQAIGDRRFDGRTLRSDG